MNRFTAAVYNKDRNNLSKIITIFFLLALSVVSSASPQLTRISCNSNTYSTPGTDACSVYLTSNAKGKLGVTLKSNNPAVTLPSRATVKSGTMTTEFNATVAGVTTEQTATITAEAGGVTQTFSLTLSPASGVAALTTSATSVSFGNVAVGGTGMQSVTLTSSGTASVTISSISVAGSLFGAAGISTPVTLNPGQKATMSVTFSPLQPSPGYNYTGTVTITSNAATATVSMNGAGIAVTPTVSAVSCSSTSITGSLADACTLSLSGPAPTGGLTVSLASSNSSVTLPASATVPVTATSAAFIANVASVSSAQVATLSAIAGSISKTVSLQLNAATPSLTASTPSVSFGNVSVGSTGTQSVTLTSSGTAPVTISSISVAGSLFGAAGITTPVTLNPGQIATLTLTFSPLQSPGYNYTGIVTITSNAATATVSMSGAGIAVTPTVSSLSCGITSITGSLADACTVSLSSAAPTGGLNVSLASNNSSVTVPVSVTVPAAATNAAFIANAAAVNAAQSVILTAITGSTSKTVSLQLNAASAALTLNATSIGFGNVMMNTPVAQPITLSSTGTAPVTVNSAAVSGASFSVSGGTFPATLNPGQSLTLEVQFDPASAGSFAGQLAISSSASSPTLELSGVGESHQVNLSWLSPSGASDPVVGYNVYRAPLGTTTYQRVNTSVDTQTAFTDSSVQSSFSYDYIVTSIDAQGIESVPSNTTTVTIP